MAWLTIFFGILAIIVIVLFWILLTSRPSSSTSNTQITGLTAKPANSTNMSLGSSNSTPICRVDTDCNPNGDSSILCINGQCVPRTCRTDKDCISTETCFQNYCHPTPPSTVKVPCSDTSTCGSVLGQPYCVSGFCSSQPATPPPNALFEHDTCTTDADCSTGKCIDTGGGIKYCTVPNFNCFFNYSGTEGNYICGADTPYCVQGRCTTNELGAPCSRAAECGTGLCVNGQCAVQPGRYGDTCTTNTDCQSGMKCNAGYCVPVNYQPRRFDQTARVQIPLAQNYNFSPITPMGTGITPPIYPDNFAVNGRPTVPLSQQNLAPLQRNPMGEFTGSIPSYTPSVTPVYGGSVRTSLAAQVNTSVPMQPLGSGLNIPTSVSVPPRNGPAIGTTVANNPPPRPGTTRPPGTPISGVNNIGQLSGPPPSVTGWMGSGLSNDG